MQWQNDVQYSNNTLGMMNRTSTFVDKKTVMQMNKSFIMPSYDYVDAVGNGFSKYRQRQLQTLQNRAAHIIEGNCDFINTRGLDLLKELRIQTLEDREN